MAFIYHIPNSIGNIKRMCVCMCVFKNKTGYTNDLSERYTNMYSTKLYYALTMQWIPV